MAQVTHFRSVIAFVSSVILVFVVYRAAAFVLEERERSLISTMPKALTSEGYTEKPPVSEMLNAPETKAPETKITGNYRGTQLRLTDELGKAEITSPDPTERGFVGLFNQHWRRHHCPFAGPHGARGRYVQAVSLTVRRGDDPDASSIEDSLSEEEKKTRYRETQIFGLSEGSYDERESLVFPTPTRIRYPVHLPVGAKFRFSPAVLGEASVNFTVNFRSNRSKSSIVLCSKNVRGPSNHWTDVEVELPRESTDGILELVTTSDSKTPSIGLFGSPVIVADASTKIPYNVVFVIVDAMRGDAIAASHDPATDAKIAKAPLRPLDARIPAIPEVAPNLNQLASTGVIWENIWSSAMWTRPATVAMLSGKYSSHLGLSVSDLELTASERKRFYASNPPMLPRYFRERGANTAAFVNNMYLSGSVGVGLDYAFEVLIDHRFAALDTKFITNDALAYLQSHRDERFFMLLNYASPHSPHAPPKPHLDALRGAPGLPEDLHVRAYLGEIHKDDAAIGKVIEKIDELGLREKTLVVVTADHGETMSAAHDWVAYDVAKGAPSGRFTHLSTMWEEAARSALILSLPGKLPKGLLAKARVQTLDLLPTILEIEGITGPENLDGRSLVPLFSKETIEERPVVVEGRGARSIQVGNFRLVVRDPIARRLRVGRTEFVKDFELYDHDRDPGERNDLARRHPEIVERLRKRLEEVSSSSHSTALSSSVIKYHLQFARGGKSGPVTARFFARGGSPSNAKMIVKSNDLGENSIRQLDNAVSVNFDRPGNEVVALVVEVYGNDVELGWSISFAGQPWPKEKVFGGALGMLLPDAAEGIVKSMDATRIESRTFPHVVGEHEFGLYVTREPIDGPLEIEPSSQAQLEAEQAMQAWGYAKKPAKKP